MRRKFYHKNYKALNTYFLKICHWLSEELINFKSKWKDHQNLAPFRSVVQAKNVFKKDSFNFHKKRQIKKYLKVMKKGLLSLTKCEIAFIISQLAIHKQGILVLIKNGLCSLVNRAQILEMSTNIRYFYKIHQI